MASTALYLKPENRMLYRDQWSDKEVRLALWHCMRTLRYVGEVKTDRYEDGSITFVVRRLCTDKERSHVTENWLE